MEIRLYFQMIKRGWWVILLVALVALAGSLALSYLAVPQYRASATFIISPNASLINGRDVVDSLDKLNSSSVTATYAEVMNSNRIYADTLANLQLNSTDLVEYSYTVVVLPDSSVLELSVSGPNPDVTAELANSIGYQSINYTRLLNQVYDLNFLDVANTPTEPSSPQPLRDAGLAVLLGVVTGAVLVILGEQIRTPIDSLRRRSMLDTSSSALNRHYFQRGLEETQARSESGNVGLGLIQLDGLRDLIETLPPMISQQVLHVVTHKLRNELRGNDIVGRWGDVEFAVMLPSTPIAAAERTLDRIHQALLEPIFVEQSNDTVYLEPYVAVAVSQPQEAVNGLIDRAEKVLSQARMTHLAEKSSVDN